MVPPAAQLGRRRILDASAIVRNNSLQVRISVRDNSVFVPVLDVLDK